MLGINFEPRLVKSERSSVSCIILTPYTLYEVACLIFTMTLRSRHPSLHFLVRNWGCRIVKDPQCEEVKEAEPIGESSGGNLWFPTDPQSYAPALQDNSPEPHHPEPHHPCGENIKFEGRGGRR